MCRAVQTSTTVPRRLCDHLTCANANLVHALSASATATTTRTPTAVTVTTTATAATTTTHTTNPNEPVDGKHVVEIPTELILHANLNTAGRQVHGPTQVQKPGRLRLPVRRWCSAPTASVSPCSNCPRRRRQLRCQAQLEQARTVDFISIPSRSTSSSKSMCCHNHDYNHNHISMLRARP